ncbi:hypothetical protein ACFFP0_02045 [Rhizobium puerariae]|uniref:Uncharacterized protein n=1 Tax=Rhizobium puerariae TaxID=1585791 RepID=A0ABV6AAP1_9HYPH
MEQHRAVEALARAGKTAREIIISSPAYSHQVLVESLNRSSRHLLALI